MARARESFDRASLAGSLLVHAVVLVAIVGSSFVERPPLDFITYQIELVSPPAAALDESVAPEPEELVVERPDPVLPEPEPEAATLEQEREQPPEPTPDEPPRTAPPEQPAEAEAARADEPPPEEPAESGAGVNVRLEGVRRDYPAYYDNIITQIQRCFRWQGGGSWETTVYFEIRRDGSVAGLDFVRRSGNTGFDFEAMGAVDCAGRGRFGPLPEELPFDVLPVQFNFRPRGGPGGEVGVGGPVVASSEEPKPTVASGAE